MDWAPNRDARGVLWVDVTHLGQRIRLQGMDVYWRSGDRFGAFNPLLIPSMWGRLLGWMKTGWSPSLYQGRQSVSYRATDTGFADTAGELPEGHLPVLLGIRIPDDEWAEVSA